MSSHDSISPRPITWERAAEIFANPSPPKHVWQQQFDQGEDALIRLKSPYEKIDFKDLWYYYMDLTYVELQPDLFKYVFPICLMDWHNTLQGNLPCSNCSPDFTSAMCRGQILERMLTGRQRNEVVLFFRDSFLQCVDSLQSFTDGGQQNPPHRWLGEFNALGLIISHLEQIWVPWWCSATVGRAIAVLEYCSGLMYYQGENHFFADWTPKRGGGGPYLWAHNADIDERGWLPENVKFLSETLTAEFVGEAIRRAVARMIGSPDLEKARQLERDFSERIEIVRSRTAELPVLLSGKLESKWSTPWTL